MNAKRMLAWSRTTVLWAGLGLMVVIAFGESRMVGRCRDLWRLETNYRLLSFLALGLVLIVLGFIYNRYQEKIQQWL